MGFDLKRCLERDGGKAFRTGKPVTLLCRRPKHGEDNWLVVEGHIDINGILRDTYTLDWGPISEGFSNLPDPPRRVKVRDCLVQNADTKQTVTIRDPIERVPWRVVANAIRDQLGDLEIELKD